MINLYFTIKQYKSVKRCTSEVEVSTSLYASVQLDSWLDIQAQLYERFCGGEGFKLFVSYVILRLYKKNQCPTMSGTGLKVCLVVRCGGAMVCKPIIVFSLAQAEQNQAKAESSETNVGLSTPIPRLPFQKSQG